MNPLDLISMGKKLSNIYQELSAPICRSNGLNQTGLDVLLFLQIIRNITRQVMFAIFAELKAVLHPLLLIRS